MPQPRSPPSKPPPPSPSPRRRWGQGLAYARPKTHLDTESVICANALGNVSATHAHIFLHHENTDRTSSKRRLRGGCCSALWRTDSGSAEDYIGFEFRAALLMFLGLSGKRRLGRLPSADARRTTWVVRHPSNGEKKRYRRRKGWDLDFAPAPVSICCCGCGCCNLRAVAVLDFRTGNRFFAEDTAAHRTGLGMRTGRAGAVVWDLACLRTLATKSRKPN